MADVFVSYSHVDASLASELGLAIDNLGITYFRDSKDIKWGDSIDVTVQTALEDANALMVIVSPASLNSLWVPYEIGYFSALKRPILPYLTHPSLELPSYIANRKYVETVSDVTAYLSAMKNQLRKPQTKTTAPLPDVRIRSSAAIMRKPSGKSMTLVSIGAENHDVNPVYISSFSLLLDDGRRMQILRDGISGLPVTVQELRPGQRFDVRITRQDLGIEVKPTNVVGVVVIDQIGRQFHGDSNRVQACIAELFGNDEGQ